MKKATQKEINKAFKNCDLSGLNYFVDVDGKTYTSEFTYGGLRDCQLFIHDNGKPNTNYKIIVIKVGE